MIALRLIGKHFAELGHGFTNHLRIINNGWHIASRTAPLARNPDECCARIKFTPLRKNKVIHHNL